MKSHELAKQLLENPDVELYLQKDDEGNGYRPMNGVDFNFLYLGEDEVYPKNYNEEYFEGTEEEWNEYTKDVPPQAVFY